MYDVYDANCADLFTALPIIPAGAYPSKRYMQTALWCLHHDSLECSDIIPPYWTVTFLLGYKSTLLTRLRISLFGRDQVGMQVFHVL